MKCLSPVPLQCLLTPAAARGSESTLPPGPPRSSPAARSQGVCFPACMPASCPQSPRALTETLVGSLGCAPGPRAVLEEGQTALTVCARGVVLALADQLARLIGATLAGVPIAFAPGKRTGVWTPGGTGRGGVSHQEAPASGEPNSVAQLQSSIEHLLCARAAVTEPTTLGCSGLYPHLTDGGTEAQRGCPRPPVSYGKVHKATTAGFPPGEPPGAKRDP